MRLTRQAEYAMRTLLELARAPVGEVVETAVIARRQAIPAVFLKKTVQALARAGLVETRRGAGGGVRLLRPATQVTLADAITATEGHIAFNPCLGGAENCPNAPSCQIRRAIRRGQMAFIEEMRRESLADLVSREIIEKSNPALDAPDERRR